MELNPKAENDQLPIGRSQVTMGRKPKPEKEQLPIDRPKITMGRKPKPEKEPLKPENEPLRINETSNSDDNSDKRSFKPLDFSQPKKGLEEEGREAYERLLEKSAPLFEMAEATLRNFPTSSVKGKQAYFYKKLTENFQTAIAEGKDINRLTPALLGRVSIAKKLIAEAPRTGPSMIREKLIQDQIDLHTDVKKTMTAVKRTSFNKGYSKSMGDSDSPEFTSLIECVKELETAVSGTPAVESSILKKAQPAIPGLNSKEPTPPNLAQEIKTKCAAVINAAQKYLDTVGGKDELEEDPVARKKLLARKQQAEVAMTGARHLALAMDFDQIPEPNRNELWTEKDSLKMSGIRIAMSFERGGQKATKLDRSDNPGQSESFWIREQTDEQIVESMSKKEGNEPPKSERSFIFKPMYGEKPSDGMNDRKGAGAIKESLASSTSKLFALQTGINLGVPETAVVSLGDYALDGIKKGQGSPILGSAQSNAGAFGDLKTLPPEEMKKIPKDDIHRLAILDIVSLNMDRHSGNAMVRKDEESGLPRLVPIDHGCSMPTRDDFPSVKNRLGGFDGQQGPYTTFNALLTQPSAYESFDPLMQKQIELLDPEAIENGMHSHIEALAEVHPGLKPQDKIDDSSIVMSKRSLMFLKIASKFLSPAEIQIALAAHGEKLFDAEEKDFDRVAMNIIQEQIPKKQAYLDIMLQPPEEKHRIIKWLGDNGWGLLTVSGKYDPGAFMTRDPVNALKLYRMQKANDKPPVIENYGFYVAKGVGDEPPPVEVLEEIHEKLPQVDIGYGDQTENGMRKQCYAAHCWNIFNKVGDINLFKEAVQITGGKPPTTFEQIIPIVQFWRKIKFDKNLIHRIPIEKTDITVFDKLKRTLLASQISESESTTLKAAQNAVGDASEEEVLKTYAGHLETEIREIAKKLSNKNKAEEFIQRCTKIVNSTAIFVDRKEISSDLNSLAIEARTYAAREPVDEFINFTSRIIERLKEVVIKDKGELKGRLANELRFMQMNVEVAKKHGLSMNIIADNTKIYRELAKEFGVGLD